MCKKSPGRSAAKSNHRTRSETHNAHQFHKKNNVQATRQLKNTERHRACCMGILNNLQLYFLDVKFDTPVFTLVSSTGTSSACAVPATNPDGSSCTLEKPKRSETDSPPVGGTPFDCTQASNVASGLSMSQSEMQMDASQATVLDIVKMDMLVKILRETHAGVFDQSHVAKILIQISTMRSVTSLSSFDMTSALTDEPPRSASPKGMFRWPDNQQSPTGFS